MVEFKHSVLVFWAALILVCVASGAAAVEAVPAKEESTAKQPPRVVMLRIDGQDVTVQDYVNFLQRNTSYVHSSMTPEGKADAVRAVIANVLLQEDIKRKGLMPDSDKPTAAKLGLAYTKLAEQYFPLPPLPDEKEAYQYYLDHQNDFGIPEMVRVSQIQFRVPENASEEQKAAAKKRADAALKRLEAGEPFAQLAGELTENPQAKLPQGDLGFLPRERDRWLKAAIQGLKVGEHTKVIESPVGYEILMVTDVREALISPYANVRNKVMRNMRAKAQAKQRDAYVKELAKTAKIEIVQEELKPLFPNGVFP